MGVGRLRWLACIACAVSCLACGDDGGENPGLDTGDRDAGGEAGNGGTGGRDAGDDPRGGRGGGGSGQGGGGATDAGMDAMPNPFDYDASGDYNNTIPDGAIDAGPAPEDWVCPEALWNDGICDCSCGAPDFDCSQFSCSEPGCVADTCDACFSASLTWKPCTPAPDPSDWTCDPLERNDISCDCGCGIPDPACMGRGCSEPGCRKDACTWRHNCAPGTLTSPGDDCSSLTPNVTWTCAWDHYGSGDGCHCGCGAKDPDCAGQGCTTARCFDATCDACSDEDGRPYPCAAAEGGWDDDVQPDAEGNQRALCNGLRFGAGDGCDCGCGGLDPDCGEGQGCAAPGCIDAACDRCTDNTGAPYPVVGCNVPADWIDLTHCDPASYGTGDGCDCGCGVPDPDCGAAMGCTTPGCVHEACDVCNYGGQTPPYVVCNDAGNGITNWTCTHPDVFNSSDCDCGCGVIDPACREAGLLSCTEAGCETAACDFCNDGGDRSACGGGFDADGSCDLDQYGVDGLCDCGCGAADPDCAQDEGCTEPGCTAPGCEVCHGFGTMMACPVWACDAAEYRDGEVCDCGCGAQDPDCGNQGCEEPGCSQEACEICHDPFGRPVKCP